MKTQFTIRQVLAVTAFVGVALAFAGLALTAVRYSQSLFVDTNTLIGSELYFEEFHFQPKRFGVVQKNERFTLNGKELSDLAKLWTKRSGLNYKTQEEIFWAGTEVEYVAHISNGKKMEHYANISELNDKVYITFFVTDIGGDSLSKLFEAEKFLSPARLSELGEWTDKEKNSPIDGSAIPVSDSLK